VASWAALILVRSRRLACNPGTGHDRCAGEPRIVQIDESPVFAYRVRAFFIYPALLVGGPLGEEPGWRGFAFPRLQRQYGPLVGTLILGPVWAFWHVPIWLTAWRVAEMQNIYNVILFVLFISLWTFVFTWVFNNTRGSVLVAILVHASGDAFPNAILGPVFPASVVVTNNGVNVGYYGLVIAYAMLTVLVVVLTRGRLDYEHYLAEEKKSIG
jgi:membrane protease YdiL (CAAX protease family)